MTQNCPCCGQTATKAVLSTPPLPVNSCVLTRSQEIALRFPRATMDLLGCEYCGFVWNASFDEEVVVYDQSYEGTQIHSAHFRAYLRGMAAEWLANVGGAPASILEVGCGQGEFLSTLAELTSARLVGYDPAFRGLAPGGVEIIAERLPGAVDQSFDLVINRMTLEHIPHPRRFIQTMTEWLAPGGTLITQVPNAARTIDEGVACDLFYEHVNCFTQTSLGQLHRSVGLRHISFETGFDHQHLTAFAQRAPDFGAGDTQPRSANRFQRLTSAIRTFSAQWPSHLEALRASGREIWVWGAGSRATTFIALLPDPSLVSGVVDINPARDGTFVLGSACQTHIPRALAGRDNLAVIVMNPIYMTEIATELAAIQASALLVPLKQGQPDQPPSQ